MILGGDALGTVVLGQLSRKKKRLALGATLDVSVTLIAGVASAETVPVRFAGGAAFTRSRRISAPGAVITVSASIIPGVARVGHEITVNQADGNTRVVVIFGATDADLRDEAFIHATVYDDWDWWLFKQSGKAA